MTTATCRVRFDHVVATAIGLALAACGSGSPAKPDSGAPADTSGVDGGSGGLSVVSLTSTVATVTGGMPSSTETDTVDFVAIVTDAAGLETVAGGELLDDNGRTYGAFQAGANKGTYSATLTYEQMNQVAALDFTGTGERTFVAKFFDNSSNTATSNIEIALACRDAFGLEGACGGACSMITFDPSNCGACGSACATGLACENGQCKTISNTCIASRSIADGTTCQQVLTAVAGACPSGTMLVDEIYYGSTSCTGTATVLSANESIGGRDVAPAYSIACACQEL